LYAPSRLHGIVHSGHIIMTTAADILCRARALRSVDDDARESKANVRLHLP
jgi:hypothetical protein